MNILVFAAHPDDAEIGMGGTIARLAALGHSVLICDLTDGSPTPRGDRESRIREAAEALERLQPAGRGVPIRRVMLDLKNREVQHTIEARHKAAGVIRAHQARMVFAPHWEDAHPDHVAAARLCEDARFDAKLTKVEMPVPPGMQPGAPIYPRWFFHYDISHLRASSTRVSASTSPASRPPSRRRSVRTARSSARGTMPPRPSRRATPRRSGVRPPATRLCW